MRNVGEGLSCCAQSQHPALAVAFRGEQEPWILRVRLRLPQDDNEVECAFGICRDDGGEVCGPRSAHVVLFQSPAHMLTYQFRGVLGACLKR